MCLGLFQALYAFQSTPGFKAGRYVGVGDGAHADSCFNPLPALRPGDTGNFIPISTRQMVSIHSRL